MIYYNLYNILRKKGDNNASNIHYIFNLLINITTTLLFIIYTSDMSEIIFSKKEYFIIAPLVCIISLIPIRLYSLVVCLVLHYILLHVFLGFDVLKVSTLYFRYIVTLILSNFFLFTIHTLIFNDSHMMEKSTLYSSYKQANIVVISYVMYVLFSKFKDLHLLRNYYLLAFNILIMGVCILLSYVTLLMSSQNLDFFVLPTVYTCIYFLVLTSLLLYNVFLHVIEKNAEYKIQLEANSLEQLYAIQIDKKLKALHAIRHDMKNHLLTIDAYANHDDCKSIHDYIRNCSDKLSITRPLDTGNNILSALLNAKQQLAFDLNLECDIKAGFIRLNISDYTITTLIGNLFDNAITAASKCDSGWIKCEIKQIEYYLKISIENNHCEKIRVKDGQFISTKPNKDVPHGIGIKNVKEAIKRSDGLIDISYTDDIFLVKILVPNDVSNLAS